jgi:hypothetical protein
MKQVVKNWIVSHATIQKAMNNGFMVSIKLNNVWYSVVTDSIEQGYNILTEHVLANKYVINEFLKELMRGTPIYN